MRVKSFTVRYRDFASAQNAVQCPDNIEVRKITELRAPRIFYPQFVCSGRCRLPDYAFWFSSETGIDLINGFNRFDTVKCSLRRDSLLGHKIVFFVEVLGYPLVDMIPGKRSVKINLSGIKFDIDSALSK